MKIGIFFYSFANIFIDFSYGELIKIFICDIFYHAEHIRIFTRPLSMVTNIFGYSFVQKKDICPTLRQMVWRTSQMVSEKYQMVSVRCQMVSERDLIVSGWCQMVSGRSQMLSGRCKMLSGRCQI